MKFDGNITKKKKDETHSFFNFLYTSFPTSQTLDHFDPKLEQFPPTCICIKSVKV